MKRKMSFFSTALAHTHSYQQEHTPPQKKYAKNKHYSDAISRLAQITLNVKHKWIFLYERR